MVSNTHEKQRSEEQNVTDLLNKDIRPQIVSAVIRHAFKPRLEVLNLTAAELLRHLVVREVGHDTYEAMNRIYERFPNAINRINNGTVNILGQRHFIGGWTSRGYHGQRFVGIIECEAEYVLYHAHSAQYAQFDQIDPEASEDLAKMVERYSADRERVTEEAKARKAEITAIIDACRTFDQLASAWPDVMPIANQFRPTAKAKLQLPALVNKNLSLALNLPPEERMAA
jgi:hypothetical protein